MATAATPAWLTAHASGTVLCTGRHGALRRLAVKRPDDQAELIVKELRADANATSEEAAVTRVGALGPHPHILAAQLFRTSSSLLIVHARLPTSLYDHVRQRGAPTCRADALRTVDIVGQIATAVSFLHEHGVAHRGVHPEAVLLSGDLNGTGRVVAQLGDYGAACALSEDADWPVHLPERWLPAEAHGSARFVATPPTAPRPPTPTPAASAAAPATSASGASSSPAAVAQIKAPVVAAVTGTSGWEAWDVWQVGAVAAFALGAGKPHALLQRAWRGALTRAPHPRKRIEALPVSWAFAALIYAATSPVPLVRPTVPQLLLACTHESEAWQVYKTPPTSGVQLQAKLRGVAGADELLALNVSLLEQVNVWLTGNTSSPNASQWHERLDVLLRVLPPNAGLHVPAPADLAAQLSSAVSKHSVAVAAIVLGEPGQLVAHLHHFSSATQDTRTVSVQRVPATGGAHAVVQASEKQHGSAACALAEYLAGAQALRGSQVPVRSALRVGVHVAPWALPLKSERLLEDAVRDPGVDQCPPLVRLLGACKRVLSSGSGTGQWLLHMSEPEAASALLALEHGVLRDTLFLFKATARTDEDDALEATAAMLMLNKAESELEKAKAKARANKKQQQSKPSAPYADFALEAPLCPLSGAMSSLARATMGHGTASANGTRHESAHAVVNNGRVFRRPLTGYWRSTGGAFAGHWAAAANRATQQTVLIGALRSGGVAWALGHPRTDLSFRFSVVHLLPAGATMVSLTLVCDAPVGHAASPRVWRGVEMPEVLFTEETGPVPVELTELPARCTTLLIGGALGTALGPLSGTWRLAQPDPRFPTADTSFLFDVAFAPTVSNAKPLRLLLSLLFDKQDSWLEACVASEQAVAGQFFAVAAHVSAQDAATPASEAHVRPTLQAWKRVLVERALWTVTADTLMRPAKLVWRLTAPTVTGRPAPVAQACSEAVHHAMASEVEADVWALARAGQAGAVQAWSGARELLDQPCPYEQHQHCTPLMVAATSGDVPVVKALIDRGADPRAATAPFYSAPLDWAAVRERRDVLAHLLALPSMPVTASLLRAAIGKVELLELLRSALTQASRRKAGDKGVGGGGNSSGSAGGKKGGKGAAKSSPQSPSTGKNKFAGLMDSGDE